MFLYAVDQIEVKIVGLAAPQLFFEYFFDIWVGDHIKLAGQIVAVPWIAGQSFAQETL